MMVSFVSAAQSSPCFIIFFFFLLTKPFFRTWPTFQAQTLTSLKVAAYLTLACHLIKFQVLAVNCKSDFNEQDLIFVQHVIYSLPSGREKKKK